MRALDTLPVGIVLLIAVLSTPTARAASAKSELKTTEETPTKLALDRSRERLTLADTPEPFKPQRPRSQADRDRVEALSLYAAGRLHERRKQDAEALRCFQRALRFDPQAATVGWACVGAAVRLRRLDVAARYALKTPDAAKGDLYMLRQLGVQLTKRADWQGAVALYEKALQAQTDQTQGGTNFLLRMEIGRLFCLVGEYAKAADQFAKVAKAIEFPDRFGLDEKITKILLSEPDTTYNTFGECYLEADRLDEAAAAFEKAHEAAPDPGLLNYHLAQIEARRGKPAKALAKLEAYFDAEQKNARMEPYRLLAQLLEELGRREDLIDRLETLHDADPDHAPLGYFLAETYREAERFDKAGPLYRTLLEKTPTVIGYRSLIEIYRKTDRLEELLKILGEAASNNATIESLESEGEALTDDEALLDRLFQTARQLIEDRPEPLDYHTLWATAVMALDVEQFDTAEEFCRLAIEADPKNAAQVFLTWGRSFFLAERYAEAADIFARATKHDAVNTDIEIFHFYQAGALEMAERTDEALAVADQAIDESDDSVRFLSRRAWILYHARRHEEAKLAYAQLIEQFDSEYDSSQTRQVMREARLVLSSLCVLEEDVEGAVEWLEQVLDEFPDDIAAMNDLGYLWADENRHLERAHRMIQKAVDGEPDNSAYRDSLGWVLFRLGRIDEAVVELEEAAAESPDPVMLDHLADAYQAAGKPEKALDAWGKAVEAFVEEEQPLEAKKIRRKIRQNQ